MLRRKMTRILTEWKQRGPETALIITGPRQVGKSTIVREFGKRNYEVFIELNFIKNSKAKAVFETDDEAERILQNLTAFTGQTVKNGDTLILLSEIQECPQAMTAIKLLVEDGRADYVETRSLPADVDAKTRFSPADFEQSVEMHPMDFEEFLWAEGMPDEAIVNLKEYFDKRQAVPEVIHRTMLRLFRTWIVVGGMPEAVQSFVNDHDLATVGIIQKRILDVYRRDIEKSASWRNRSKILRIFDAVPGQLDTKTRRFYVSRIQPEARFRQLENSFLWLRNTMTVLVCHGLKAPQLPLTQNEKRSIFRLYMADTGLLCAADLRQIQFQILTQNLSVKSGSILENAFAQLLKAKRKKLYYYDSKTMTLDFIVESAGKLDILEIKSGKGYKRHPSLDKALKDPLWRFGQAIVFSRHNLSEEDRILYLPYYMILFYGNTDSI